MGMLRFFATTAIFAVIFYKGYQTLVFLKPLRSIFTHKPGACHTIPHANDGSEDIAMLSDGLALVSAGLRFKTDKFPDRKGRLLLFDFNHPKAVVELEIQWKDPIKFQHFNPHGIDAFKNENGEFIVFIINHNPHEAVERFRLDLISNTLVHLESIMCPEMRLQNSVVAVGEKQFYFTNFQYYKNGFLSKWELELFSFGSIGYHDGNKCKIVKSGYNAPNGLATSKDKKKLYFANVGDLSLETFDINKDGTLTLIHTLEIDTSVDNIQVDRQDGALWLGCHPSRWRLMQYFADPHKQKAPSQVLQVKTNSQGLPAGDVTEVYMDDGSQISACAVAAHFKQGLLIGSVYHNLVYCDIKH